MGRSATKAAGNPWYEARINAAKYDERLYSREGAAERLGISVDSIRNTETNTEDHMPVNKAIWMADLYKAPYLLNYYCQNVCPIGRKFPTKIEPIERVTVQFMKHLSPEKMENLQKRLVDIAEDGKIDDEELEELKEVLKEIDQMDKVLQGLLLLGRTALKGGWSE